MCGNARFQRLSLKRPSTSNDPGAAACGSGFLGLMGKPHSHSAGDLGPALSLAHPAPPQQWSPAPGLFWDPALQLQARLSLVHASLSYCDATQGGGSCQVGTGAN